MNLLSPSAINLYRSCPRGYYYRYQKPEIPRIKVERDKADLGSLFHETIIPEYFSRIPDHPKPDGIIATAKDAYESNFDQNLNNLKKRSETILANFIKFEIERLKTWRTFKPLFIERKIDSHPKYLTRIDFYGDSKIIDWKTGDIDTLDESELIQGGIYKTVLEDFSLPVEKVLFVILLTGRVLEMPQVSRGFIDSKAQVVRDGISLRRFHKNPSPLCEFCGYVLRCSFEDRCLWW